MTQAASNHQINRDDLKTKLTDIQGEAQEQVDGVKNQLLTAGILIGLVILIAAFLLGRRGGKRSSAVIEVRRA
jgi:hypothetical protein